MRSRLLTPLLDPAGAGVVMVLAPPGAGKSTLLARAADQVPGQVAWCSLGPEDRAGPGFLLHLDCALHGGTTSAIVPQDLPTVLEADSAPDCPRTLFLDDTHELAGGPAEQQLADLLRWRPPQLRIVLGARRPIAVNTPRLLVSGDLLELDGDALRFRSWEVEELFRVVYGEPLSPEAAAALTRRTGGWAAGLTLFHLATRGKTAAERERAVVELGGNSRLLRSYLTRTVLHELAPAHRTFLLHASTLGAFTGELCDALLDRDGSAATLEQLASSQLFVTAEEDGSYRFHQVMQTLLEGMLIDELGSRGAAGVYARSAELLEQRGRYADAARAHALAGDFAAVSRLLQHTSAGLVGHPHESLTLPDDDPWLAMARARQLYLEGSLDEAIAAFRKAEPLLDDAEFQQRCRTGRAAAVLWGPEGGFAQRRRQPDLAPGPATDMEMLRMATLQVVDTGDAHVSPLVRGLALLVAGQPAQAAQVLTSVPPSSTADRLAADLALAVTEFVAHGAQGLLGRLEEIVLRADLAAQPWLARLARGFQCVVLVTTEDSSWRTESCASLVEDCRDRGDLWGATLLSAALGMVLAPQRAEEAQSWFASAAEGAQSVDAPVLETWATAMAAAMARRCGSPDLPRLRARAQSLSRGCGLSAALDKAQQLLDRPSSPAQANVLPEQRGPRSHAFEAPTQVRCFGSFALELGGRGIELPALRPLPRTLLLVLALHHGQDLHREVLIDLFWPGTSVEDAAHRLHAAASSVRRALAVTGLPVQPGAESVLRRHGDAYRLEIEGAEHDVTAFETWHQQGVRAIAHDDQELALSSMTAALEVYRADLLPEAGPAEWIVEERARLRLAAATAAYTAGRLALRLRAAEEALHWAQRATSLDPLRDSAWALLAEVQARMGDLTAAAATRAHHARVRSEVTLTRG